MGTLKPCYSISGESVEIAVLELYDETEAINVGPTNPGFDDLLGEPFFEDLDLDGIGERVRPSTTVSIKAKAEFSRFEEQRQDQVGNAPDTFMNLVVSEEELVAKGLLTSGVLGIRPNDRLLRLETNKGVTRVDFQEDARDPVYVFEVRPGSTGERTYTIMLEKRRPVAR